MAFALAASAVLSASPPASAGTTWGQLQRLVAPDVTGGDGFGSAVAISGQTVLVGAPEHDGDGGAVYFFAQSGARWALQQEIQPMGSVAGTGFGVSVALSGDTAFVGAIEEGDGAGAVHVYTRSGTKWTEAQTIPEPAEAPAGRLGFSVAIDGTTAIIGAPSNRTQSLLAGMAYVYVLSGSTWAQQAVLQDGIAPTDGFGTTVALSGDTAVVGAPGFGGTAAYVFVRSGTTWTLQQKLTADDVAATGFGLGVAVAGDTALVLSTTSSVGGGAVFGFARSGSTWAQAYETPPPTQAETFTLGLSMRDGTVVVGSTNTTMNGLGQANVYSGGGVSPTPDATISPGDGTAGDGFGLAVAVEGSTLVAGAPFAGGLMEGAAYVFADVAADGDPCGSDDACFSGHCVERRLLRVRVVPGRGRVQRGRALPAGDGHLLGHARARGHALPERRLHRGRDLPRHRLRGDGQGVRAPGRLPRFGSCNPSNGQCSSPAKPDGVACPGGRCQGGVCMGPEKPMPVTACGGGCEVGDAPDGGAVGVGLALLLAVRRGRRRGAGGSREKR